MNGPDHYRRAAELLRAAESGGSPPPPAGCDSVDAMLSAATLIAAAAVHERLAKTAAYVELVGLAQTDQLTLPANQVFPHLEGLPPEAEYIRFKGNAWHDAIQGPVDPAGELIPEGERR